MMVAVLCVSAVPAAGDQTPDWNNLEVLHRHRLPARAFAFPFSDVDRALEHAGPAEYLESSRLQLLNGEWNFAWAETPDRVVERFWENPPADATTIPVPSNIELHGFGFPNYSNIPYHFSPMDPPNIPADQNWVGCFWRSFEVPASWRGDRRIIRFEGAGSAIDVWVNGEHVGYAEDGRTSIEFDITEATRPGTNTVAVKTYRLSNGSYLECQDFWRLSGIYRDVLVWAAPAVHVWDLGIRTELHDSGDATLEVEIDIDARANADELTGGGPVSLNLSLFDDDGELVASRDNGRVPVTAGHHSALRHELSVPSPALWTAETPELYTLVTTLKTSDGETIESIPQRVGFREISTASGRLEINGNPVLIRGVNRHEHEAETAHAITLEGMLEDIRLMKQNNFNAVRTCHYPNHPVWYQLCDEHGLYVTDEANVESHGIGYKPAETLANKPEWTAAHVDRFERMVRRDRNFPSIIAWSLGNEMGDGVAITAAYRWGKRFDPTRPVQSERAEWATGNTDMAVPMYATPGRIERYATKDGVGKPLVLCEYSHAMGNSNGNFDWYWNLFKEHESLGGGYIWDWCDQGLAVEHEGETIFAYGGWFEPEALHHDDNFCMNGVVNSDRTLKPAMVAIRHAQQPIDAELIDAERGVVRVTSWYDHVDPSDELVGSFSILEDGVEIASGEMPVPSLSPRGSAEVELPRPVFLKLPGSEYHLDLRWHTKDATEMVPAGHEIAWAQFPLASSALPTEAPRGRVRVETRGGSIVASMDNGVQVTIDEGSGLIESIVGADGELLVEPLSPYFWRAPIDNDRGYKMPNESSAWRDAGASWQAEYVGVVSQSTGEVIVNARGRLGAVGAGYELTYTLRGDGEVHVAASMQRPDKGVGAIPRFGMRVRLVDGLETLHWFGPGPQESYWDRDELPIGRWEAPISEQAFPYSEPQETGNHVSTRWAYLSDSRGRGLLVMADAENCSVPEQALSLAAVPFDAHEADLAKYDHELRTRGVFLHLDTAQTGVGGDNSWGARPKGRYTLRPVPHRVAFTLRPLGSPEEILGRTRRSP